MSEAGRIVTNVTLTPTATAPVPDEALIAWTQIRNNPTRPDRDRVAMIANRLNSPDFLDAILTLIVSDNLNDADDCLKGNRGHIDDLFATMFTTPTQGETPIDFDDDLAVFNQILTQTDTGESRANVHVGKATLHYWAGNILEAQTEARRAQEDDSGNSTARLICTYFTMDKPRRQRPCTRGSSKGAGTVSFEDRPNRPDATSPEPGPSNKPRPFTL